jgi:hypothetical protein
MSNHGHDSLRFQRSIAPRGSISVRPPRAQNFSHTISGASLPAAMDDHHHVLSGSESGYLPPGALTIAACRWDTVLRSKVG